MCSPYFDVVQAFKEKLKEEQREQDIKSGRDGLEIAPDSAAMEALTPLFIFHTSPKPKHVEKYT